jgi:hypothetical protein
MTANITKFPDLSHDLVRQRRGRKRAAQYTYAIRLVNPRSGREESYGNLGYDILS